MPLFKLVPGVATSSDGLACAKLGGLPAPLLARAKEVMDLLEAGKPIAPAACVAGSSGGGTGLASVMGPGSASEELIALFLETPSFGTCDDASINRLMELVLEL